MSAFIPLFAIADQWIILSSFCSAIATSTTVLVTVVNFRQRRADILQRRDELRDREIEREERDRERRLRQRTVLLALQQETQTNIQRCREHQTEPLLLTDWLRWAEEIALIDGSIYRAATAAQPFLERVNRAILNPAAWSRVEGEQDEALDALLTLAGWIEHELQERLVRMEDESLVPPTET